ncbi:hypothetical protein COOONC_27199 [Cooperia oncophora]
MVSETYGSSHIDSVHPFLFEKSHTEEWFVDARSYMSHAADMMELAREEIFIAGWWLSPELEGIYRLESKLICTDAHALHEPFAKRLMERQESLLRTEVN